MTPQHKPSLHETIEIVEQEYSAFLDQVVGQHVLQERTRSLQEREQKQIDKGTHVDVRVVKLMSISGKGGAHPAPDRQHQFSAYTNVTLLDHLLSVVRGAMTVAAYHWCYLWSQHPESEALPEDRLRQRLRTIAAIGFLHDLDKIEQLERDTSLTLDQVEYALTRYGLIPFLQSDAPPLTPSQIRYLIAEAEATQSNRYPLDKDLPKVSKADMAYVALADKLDGLWLSSAPLEERIRRIRQRIQRMDSMDADWFPALHVVDIFDPHHPFLLDGLQSEISWSCVSLTGLPPLIETHHDGRLIMLIHQDQSQEVIEEALDAFIESLPFQLELTVSNRGVPELRNGRPSHRSLTQKFLPKLEPGKLSDLFRVKADLREIVTAPLDSLLRPWDLAPRWPKNFGQLASLFAQPETLSNNALDALRTAAHLALLLNLKVPAKPKDGIPTSEIREQELLNILPEAPPEWITSIADPASRRTMTALWCWSLTGSHPEVMEHIWGETGLLQRWLEGDSQRPGFQRFFAGDGAFICEQVREHFQQLLSQKQRVVTNEDASHHCLFTNEPVGLSKFEKAWGLYEVKVSAFSGRDGRLETVTSEQSDTHIGPVSIAEHKLRMAKHPGGKTSGVPTLISSPSTVGLFGGLNLKNSLGAYSMYDLSRQEIKKGQIYTGNEIYRGRYRLARYERLSEKLADQIVELQLLIKACLRLGRPFHLFRGLPVPVRDFFYYDAMPRILQQIVGGNRFRLEELPGALNRLNMAHTLMEAPGLGYEVVRLYANPSTRFQAICVAWVHFHQLEGTQAKFYHSVLLELQRHYSTHLQEGLMSESDEPLVRMGQAAATIQQFPRSGGNNAELLVFNLAFGAAIDARKAGVGTPVSLVYAVADALRYKLEKGKAEGPIHTLDDRCLAFAQVFIDEVWNGVCQGRPPKQAKKRTLGGIYRMAFVQTWRQRFAEIKAKKAAQAEKAAQGNPPPSENP